jgi:hypothetical protein
MIVANCLLLEMNTVNDTCLMSDESDSKRQKGRFCEFLATWLSPWRLIRFTWKSSLFWDVTQLLFVVSYTDFSGRPICLTLNGQAFHEECPSFTASPSQIGQIGCSEISENNYQHKLRHFPVEWRPRLHCGGNLKSRRINWSSKLTTSDELNFIFFWPCIFV